MNEKGSKLLMRAAARRRRRLYLGAGAVIVLASLVVAGSGLFNQPAAKSCAFVTTPDGVITILIHNDQVPRTAGRFSELFKEGYYGGLTWHRVETWVIQTGNGPARDPIPLELNPTTHNVRGSVAAARTNDPNSAATQFYILRADSTYLDTQGGGYSVFGTVLSGMAIVDNVSIDQPILASSLGTCPA